MRGSKLIWTVATATAIVAGLIVVAASGAAAPRAVISRAKATSLAAGSKSSVIIVLKNQATSTPATKALTDARKATIARAQAPLLDTLSQAGAKDVHKYTLIDAVSATVPTSDVSALKDDPAVSKVVPNTLIPAPTPAGSTTSGVGSAGGAVSPATGACAAPGKVQLNPEALEQIGADSDVPGAQTARSLGITGAGVKVAFIADGLDPNDPDFIRANGQHVFFDYEDFTGDGTNAPTGGEEAFGDAASIASQGREVYNVSHYSALPLNRPCLIRIEGVAPGASLAGLDVFGSGDGLNSSIIEAIDYAVTVDHVNVINESFGANYYPDDEAALDLLKQANDAAIAAGTTVVVSSGDAGSTSTVGTPSTDPDVISAGATTSYRLYLQDGYGGAHFPGVTGWLDNDISSFSSGGEEQDGQTVDLVAPGELNWSLCSTDVAIYQDCTDLAGNPSNIIAFGGTSESAPLTSGTAALVIQAYRIAHHGASPTPAQVKQIIASTADDIGSPADQQGAGMIDAYKAVLAAESYGGGGGPSGPPGPHRGRPQRTPGNDTVLMGSSQLDATAPVGTTEHLSDTVTNNSSSPETVNLSTRAIGAYTTVKTATVTLSDTASPHIADWQGVNNNYEPVTFHVSAGENRLNAAIAFQNASATDLDARVRLTLIDPHGKLAAYSVPQGNGNYGDVQVTDPAPGTWTAYIYSRDSADGGTTGPVVFGANVASYTSFGAVSPSSLHLAPGASGNVTLTVPTPSHPGDAAGAIVLGTSSGSSWHGAPSTTTTVPVVLRSLIPTGQTSFSGLLTGGNGRELTTGQSNYYEINVPAGQPALNSTITLADNPNNVFDAWLVDPAGEAEAFSANNELVNSSSGPTAVNTLGSQLHVLSPAAGTWTLIVVFAPQVSGVALTEPFTVTMNENKPAVSVTGLPDSASTQLAAGTPVTVPVTVTNTGTSPESFFMDPRLASSTQYDLAPVTPADITVPDNVNLDIPYYLVPTDSTTATALAQTTGTLPIQFDTQPSIDYPDGVEGDPDIASNQGLSVSATMSANPLTQGLWAIAPQEVGPFGAAPAPTENVNTSMLADTAAFDPAVTSSTGDLWLTSINPTATYTPLSVNPGQTSTINVTLTPSGASGSVVSGTLYVDDADLVQFGETAPNGNQVAALPYEYTVK
jgi:Subtilase family